MTVQRTADELVIRLPLSMANEQIEAFLDYLEIMAILQRAQGTEEEAQALAEEANQNWYANEAEQ